MYTLVVEGPGHVISPMLKTQFYGQRADDHYFKDKMAVIKVQSEGGPGKQVTTTDVGPGNVSRWKLIFFRTKV